MVRELTPSELAARLKAGEPTLLVDVRQPEEHAIGVIPGSVRMPLGELPVRAGEIDPPAGTLVVAICHHGVRSYKAAMYLKQVGVEDVASLAGGVEAWSLQVDAGLPRY